MLSGIYKITCYNNDKFYIGSSTNINRRLKEHVGLLRNNKHSNPRLQKDWNKYGEKNFKYEIIETIHDTSKLLIKEKWWLDNTKCYERKIGFNISSNPRAGAAGKFIDLTGLKFDRLLVIKYEGKTKNGHSKWLCECTCKKKIIVSGNNLKSVHTRSCGCLKKEFAGKQNLKHGKSKSKIHKIWRDMIQRCTNPRNPVFKDYGGRGVTVCYRWSNKNPIGFQNFYEDVGDPPKRKSFGRIDNNKLINGYSQENYRWVTNDQKHRNTKRNRNYFMDGRDQCLMDIAQKYKIHPETLRNRLKKGMSIKEALILPIRKRKIK